MKDYYKGYNNFPPNLINTKYLHIYDYKFLKILIWMICVLRNEF